MRQFLKYTPNHGPLTVTPAFNVDLLVGTYTLSFWDKDGKEVFSKRGEITSDIAAIDLPISSDEDAMYMVELNATIVALLTPEEGQQYQMTLTTKQSGQNIADPAKVEGALPATSQIITIIVVLTATPSTPA